MLHDQMVVLLWPSRSDWNLSSWQIWNNILFCDVTRSQSLIKCLICDLNATFGKVPEAKNSIWSLLPDCGGVGSFDDILVLDVR